MSFIKSLILLSSKNHYEAFNIILNSIDKSESTLSMHEYINVLTGCFLDHDFMRTMPLECIKYLMEYHYRPFYTFLLCIKNTKFHDQYLLKNIFSYTYENVFIDHEYYFKFDSKCLRRMMHTINRLITTNKKDLFDFTLILAKKLNVNLNETNISIYPRTRGITVYKKHKKSDENDLYYIEKLKEYGHKFSIGYYGYDTMIYHHLHDPPL